MKLVEKDGVKIFKFDILEDVKHCFSTRVGGVSKGCYESMNLAFRGDERENVLENYDRILALIDSKKEDTVWTRQVHTDNILVVCKKDRGKGLFFERIKDGYDGIITMEEDVVLTAFSADCVLIYFYDRVKKIVGICHSGWRGTVLAIAGKMVEKMVELGSLRENIVCGIAPAIGKCCFQVDDVVIDAFKDKFDFFDKCFEVDKKSKGHYFVDLHSINERILLEAGIKKENIENSRICTKCGSDLFFSHREMGEKRGSLAGFISL